MSEFFRGCRLILALGALWIAGPVRAENEGQADLDKATEAKLNAQTLADLGEVIDLLESGLKKGLDAGNTEYANNLLASTLVQRGTALAETIFQGLPPDPRWPQLRQLALADLDKALQLNPKQPEALYLVARLNVLPGGDAKRAAEVLNQAVDLSADDAQLKAKALTLRATIQEDPQRRLADLDEAVRLAPSDAAALRTRGLLQADLGKLDEALADFDKAIGLEPKHAPTYEAKALVLARLDKLDEALVCLDKAGEISPDSVVPRIQKARIHVQQANLQAALHELNQAANLQPDNATVLMLRAAVYEELEDSQQALADVEQVLKLKPDLPAALRMRAVLLARSDKLDAAIAEMEKLHNQDPKDQASSLELAMFYMAAKRYERAIELYSAVLADAPEQWLALRGRGDALLNSGRQKEAIDDYEKALKLQAKDSGVLNNLAWVLATSPDEKIRDGKRAITLATEACEVTEYEQAHILSTLAAAYAETGDFATAVKWSEKGLEIAQKEPKPSKEQEDQKEHLAKELESYRAAKPWREMLRNGEPVEPTAPPEQGAPTEQQPPPPVPEPPKPDGPSLSPPG